MPTRKERELQFRIDIVLDAAEELFGDVAYDAASVEEIAHRAELSVATLYTLFESKRTIYKAVIARAHQRFFDELNERVDRATGPLDAVVNVVRYHLENFSRYHRQFRFFVDPGNVAASELKWEVEREARHGQEAFFARLSQICRRGIDDGVFKGGLRPEHMALVIMTVPHALVGHWLDSEGVDLLSLQPAALTLVERVTGAAAQAGPARQP